MKNKREKNNRKNYVISDEPWLDANGIIQENLKGLSGYERAFCLRNMFRVVR